MTIKFFYLSGFTKRFRNMIANNKSNNGESTTDYLLEVFA
ncbi:hypothetical protein [uncultured Gammaproteobacteria bacterium]|nr:hypothetical protein [uncultured Gammaproteobacteria bacterium]